MNYFYYFYEDALKAAHEYAQKNNGFIAKDSMILDDNCLFEYCDQKSNDLCWSGEVDAIIVRDKDSYEDIAYFASFSSREFDE